MEEGEGHIRSGEERPWIGGGRGDRISQGGGRGGWGGRRKKRRW